MVKIYIHKINREKLLREESEIFRLLPEWRKEKVQKLKVESSRLQSLVAGRLLSIALEKHPDAKYNISHSGEYVAVAVSDEVVGVDIECKKDNDFKVTKRCFEAEAIEYISGDQSRFRDVWTVKEAFLKCKGIGISVPLNSFT
ncbi:MAG: 4'-phosphopantetheinyl transferase superfamily protein, partial [Eubacterium sp.]|nr:4'-phosphopantetheinyl transferase superfamily protein [Eubacterium sp.]